ncbi:MAG: OB-fold domain-containing protein [Desulfobacteraceae bacterium]|jgi:uncharacterized OB-fold protein|nr:OB-fold domain-containing protein [Desulfobacteraceae bacterium]
MAKLPAKRPETLGGTIVHNLPFPRQLTPQALEALSDMAPLQVEQDYTITYLHSYAQDSPWFAALTNKRLLACQDPGSGYTYANPRGHDMYSGRTTRWIDITTRPAHVHAFTVCHFGSEAFLAETPFILALIAFEDVDTLLLTRLLGLDPQAASLEWIGLRVQPRFLRNSQLLPTDVYFVPQQDGGER